MAKHAIDDELMKERLKNHHTQLAATYRPRVTDAQLQRIIGWQAAMMQHPVEGLYADYLTQHAASVTDRRR